MNPSFKARKAQVKAILAKTFPDYRGRSFTVEHAARVTFHDLNWGGGTRNYYHAVRLDNPDHVGSFPNCPPWDNPVEGVTVDLPEGVVVVQHTIFCGHDLGIRFYVRPETATRLLEAGQ